MERVHITNKDVLRNDILPAWTPFSNGIMDQNNKKGVKYSEHWEKHIAKFRANPFMSNYNKIEQITIITAFVSRFIKDNYSRRSTVTV